MTRRSTAAEDAAIERLHQDFAQAWSGGDVDALVAFFADDAVRVGAAGDVEHGRDEIRSAFERLLGGPFAGASVRIERGTVRFLAADLALWQAPMEIVPGPGRPALRGYAVDVMKKVGSRWHILETHPKLFPPPPASPPADP